MTSHLYNKYCPLYARYSIVGDSIKKMEMKSAMAEDSEKEKGKMLKVIGVGFCRTGTSSLRDALTFLGFPCYHFVEMEKNKQEDIWIDILQVFKGYTATTDFPVVKMYRELMVEYPEAKIILTVRDSESWHRSVMETVYPLYDDATMVQRRKLAKVDELAVVEGTFQGRLKDKEYTISIYEQHIEEVKRLVPAEKLLVFDVKEEWDPLCKFLGVPMPEKEVSFPHSNDKSSFWKRCGNTVHPSSGIGV